MSTTTNDFAPALRATERALRYAGHARIAPSPAQHEKLLARADHEESRINPTALDRYLAARRAMEVRVRAEMAARHAEACALGLRGWRSEATAREVAAGRGVARLGDGTYVALTEGGDGLGQQGSAPMGALFTLRHATML